MFFFKKSRLFLNLLRDTFSGETEKNNGMKRLDRHLLEILTLKFAMTEESNVVLERNLDTQFPADLVIFTEEILHRKLHFLCSARDYN